MPIETEVFFYTPPPSGRGFSPEPVTPSQLFEQFRGSLNGRINEIPPFPNEEFYRFFERRQPLRLDLRGFSSQSHEALINYFMFIQGMGVRMRSPRYQDCERFLEDDDMKHRLHCEAADAFVRDCGFPNRAAAAQLIRLAFPS